MEKDKTDKVKRIVIPVLCCFMVILTAFLNVQMRNQPKEEMCREVKAKVTDIRTKYGRFYSGGLKVMAQYNGEEYELKGVPSNALHGMKMSKSMGIQVTAWLYDGSLYYAPNCISTGIDKIYYACLAATVCAIVALTVEITKKFSVR